MVEVVFNNSEKGAMKCGQHFADGIDSAAAVAIFRSDGEPPAQEEYDTAQVKAELRQEQELREGRSLGGQPQDVLGLSFALDIGDISSPAADTSRRELIAGMFRSDSGGDPWNLENFISRHWDDCVSALNQLMKRAKDGEPVRIWYSDAPYSMCGFYDTIYQLRHCACPVSAVKLPRYMTIGERGANAAFSWGEISPGAFAYYLPLEFAISDSVKNAVITEWEVLKEENTFLRVVLNGKLHSAEADFYDPFIRKEIPDGPFRVSQLIVFVLENQPGIGDWLIAQRIRNMIALGELTVVQEDSVFYDTTLKKA